MHARHLLHLCIRFQNCFSLFFFKSSSYSIRYEYLEAYEQNAEESLIIRHSKNYDTITTWDNKYQNKNFSETWKLIRRDSFLSNAQPTPENCSSWNDHNKTICPRQLKYIIKECKWGGGGWGDNMMAMRLGQHGFVTVPPHATSSEFFSHRRVA